MQGKHRLIECGCCGCYHRIEFTGDCRDDSERYGDPEEYIERNHLGIREWDLDILTEEEQLRAEEEL